MPRAAQRAHAARSSVPSGNGAKSRGHGRQPPDRRDDGVRVGAAGLRRVRQPADSLLEEAILVARNGGKRLGSHDGNAVEAKRNCGSDGSRASRRRSRGERHGSIGDQCDLVDRSDPDCDVDYAAPVTLSLALRPRSPLRPIRPMRFGNTCRAFIRSPQAQTTSTRRHGAERNQQAVDPPIRHRDLAAEDVLENCSP